MARHGLILGQNGATIQTKRKIWLPGLREAIFEPKMMEIMPENVEKNIFVRKKQFVFLKNMFRNTIKTCLNHVYLRLRVWNNILGWWETLRKKKEKHIKNQLFRCFQKTLQLFSSKKTSIS